MVAVLDKDCCSRANIWSVDLKKGKAKYPAFWADLPVAPHGFFGIGT